MTLLAGQTALWLRLGVPAGLPLFDREKAAPTTAALVRFQAKKDEACRALWASRDWRPAIASTKPGRGHAVTSMVGIDLKKGSLETTRARLEGS